MVVIYILLLFSIFKSLKIENSPFPGASHGSRRGLHQSEQAGALIFDLLLLLLFVMLLSPIVVFVYKISHCYDVCRFCLNRSPLNLVKIDAYRPVCDWMQVSYSVCCDSFLVICPFFLSHAFQRPTLVECSNICLFSYLMGTPERHPLALEDVWYAWVRPCTAHRAKPLAGPHFTARHWRFFGDVAEIRDRMGHDDAGVKMDVEDPMAPTVRGGLGACHFADPEKGGGTNTVEPTFVHRISLSL